MPDTSSPAQPAPAPDSRSATGLQPAWIVILAGVCAALHVGKLAPAVAALQLDLGLSLLQAGFVLSAVQLAGMTLGLALGMVADGLGGRRSMLLGLCILALASAAGACSRGVTALLLLRAVEGLGFLLVALPAPGLVRRLVAPQRLSLMLGVWGAYMPLATALALLLGPACLHLLGWRGWWGLLAALTLVMAAALARTVPREPPPAAAARTGPAWSERLRQTLSSAGPWLVAVSFALYSSQWLAVIGFLPTIYAQAGFAAGATALLTALAAAANIVGNLASGRLLQAGVAAPVLLAGGFAVMALAAATAFGGSTAGLSPTLRYAAVLVFSGVGGIIPGTLFSLALRVAPGEHTLATTVGWVQQWSSLGQFAGPPAVAWIASRAGGWQATGWATGSCSLLGMLLAAVLARRLAR